MFCECLNSDVNTIMYIDVLLCRPTLAPSPMVLDAEGTFRNHGNPVQVVRFYKK